MADLPTRKDAIIPKGDRSEYKTYSHRIEPLTNPHPNASDIPGMHPEAASAMDEHYANRREFNSFVEAESQRNQDNR